MMKLAFFFRLYSKSHFHKEFIDSFEMKDESKLILLASSSAQCQPLSPATKIIVACVYHLQHQIDKAYNLYLLALQTLPTSSLVWSLLGQL